jgi:hypothetical protein
MKTIIIGMLLCGKRRDDIINYCDVNYNNVIAKVIQGRNRVRPQFLVELHGDNLVTKIYMASAAAFEKLRIGLIATKPTRRLVVGKEVLGTYIIHPPTGWPHEKPDWVKMARAYRRYLREAAALLPACPRPRYPLRRRRGIEVIDLRRPEPVKFLAYHPKDKTTVLGNEVMLTSGSNRQKIRSLHIVTANQGLAKQLTATLKRQTPRRLMINDQVTGIDMVLADNRRISLGDTGFNSQETR